MEEKALERSLAVRVRKEKREKIRIKEIEGREKKGVKKVGREREWSMGPENDQ